MSEKIYIAPEWTKQSAIWLTWPSMADWWKNSQTEVLSSFAILVATISKYETVKINCPTSSVESAKEHILNTGFANISNLEFYNHPSNDVWCRDSGAIFRFNNGKQECLDFKYNAWGNKYPPFDLDDMLASKMSKACNYNNIRIDEMICEGGALEFSEDGLLLTTDCVVLNKNRNPHLNRESAEDIFKKYCGIKQVIWLKDGLYNDDTDGHIDNIARFTPESKIILSTCNKDNPSYQNLLENKIALKELNFDLIDLPLPDEFVYSNSTNKILPASYANYLVVNNAILMPCFAQEKSDQRAKSILQEVFPDRKIEMIDSRFFLQEGGAVHCLTQQEYL